MRFVVLLLAAMMASPSPAASAELNPNWSTILPGDQAIRFARQCSRNSPGPVSGTWQPSPAQIAALEPKLAGVLDLQLKLRSDVRYAPADYYRQYGGLIVNSRKVIYVNGIHREEMESQVRVHKAMPELRITDWRSEALMICDGGWITFGVEYDTETGRFSNFSFNGAI